jgi:Mg-chelatase subunit ChlD
VSVTLPEGWDAARSYHRLKRVLPSHQRRIVEDRAIHTILDRAREMLRHAARPTHSVVDTFPSEGELDLDATLENIRPWQAKDLVLTRVEPREADVVAVLDMSLSMTGEKIALVALATAILALKLDPIGVVAFDTVAHELAVVGQAVAPKELVRRVLEVPAQGYTNIDAGLRMARDQLMRSTRRERVAILLSDGIANVGNDPVERAGQLPRLHVVQIGPDDRQGTRACKGMAGAGRGRLYRATTYAQLPEVVHRLVREVFRA